MTKLAILEPGHFHAALVQKNMYAEVDPTVHVYAQRGPDLDDYVRKIEAFNGRKDNPTHWQLQVHAGPDFLDRLAVDKQADVVVISGNNRRKTEFLSRAVAAGIHTMADKPMAIDAAGFEALRRAFAVAREKGVLLYDIMTERHEITTMLQKEFAGIASVFGELQRGSVANPAVTKESVHHFSKLVSGTPIKRPAWFFDTAQQGEGLVDITTHLVDLVQWECFPGESIDYRQDIEVLGAQRWPTSISPAQFAQVTQLDQVPEFLRKDLQPDGSLHTYANGEIDYTLKGVHAKVSVIWNFEAPAGAGDTHYSIMRGSKANLVIRQGRAEAYQPVLSIEAVAGMPDADLAAALAQALPQVQATYPGVDLQRDGSSWRVTVPASYHVGHEAHFGQVTEQFLAYVASGSLPAWEEPNMLAKYYTTTKALAVAITSR
ncbi:MAG: putative oxidoreductase C-terminal domain-containing protein [Casimicrobiaceae bacterium]